MDSTSGQLEPESGARASTPGREYWPEGTASRVAAARAPEPVGKSDGKPSYGRSPGSQRRKYKGQTTTSEVRETSGDMSNQPILATSESEDNVDRAIDPSDKYVIYQTEPEEENMSQNELDKAMGWPHQFGDPAINKLIEEPHSSEDLWWNWHKPEKGAVVKVAKDVDPIFAKAMAETGQIKLYGDYPTKTEAALARPRRRIFKEER